MNNGPPLYSSHVIRVFVDYLRSTNSDVDIREIYQIAGITPEEVADAGHWFTQEQSDRFYAAVVELTGDPHVARKAGRYSASSEGISLVKQYVAGLMTTEIALLSLQKLSSMWTRHAVLKAMKVGPKKIEITSTPHEGVEEKPYQCENRLGIIEAVPMLFTNHFANIEHDACYHKGAKACHYIITWQNPPSLFLRLLRNYMLLGSMVAAVVAGFLLPPPTLLIPLLLVLFTNLAVSMIYFRQKSKELERIIDHRHDQAEYQIESANTRYNNALLVQEIGQATAAILNINELMKRLAALMSNRLYFDRGLIMLTDARRNRLIFSAGYGYSEKEKAYLKKASFNLDREDSRGYFVKAFRDQTHVVVTNTHEMKTALSEKSRRMAAVFNVHSLLCVPIIYKSTSLGILAVDNVKSKAPLKKSDIILLEGIAAQIAISISNAVSFQKLSESEEKYRQTLESMTEGYYEINREKKIIFANRALCSLLGHSASHLLGKDFYDYFLPAVREKLNQLFETITTTREPIHFSQFEIHSMDKDPLPVDLSASLILDQNSRPTGFRGILRNATERLQLEKEKKQLETQLLQAQKMEAIGTLAGGIAHNFNNWLAGILGNITLIRMDGRGHPKILQRIERIEKIIDNASKMTRQLLGYARSGGYESQPTNLNDIIKEAAATFAETKKEVTISMSLDPDLQLVKVDGHQIEQVFWNLFVNAIDAMPNGGRLHIATANTTSKTIKGKNFIAAPGRYVAITFSDNGIGIAPEDLKMIFEPFFTTKEGKGTGLGLASSYGIIKAHGGYIDVTSHPQVGTTFNIFLPVAMDIQEKDSRPSGATMEMGSGTILIVDDESMILETSEQLLARLGYSVLTASSGTEAIDTFKDQPDTIDLVIIDMIMPSMSGHELFLRLREIKPNQKTLLCSGYSLNQTARDIMKQGCEGFIQKPFNISELSRTIKRILQSDTGAP